MEFVERPDMIFNMSVPLDPSQLYRASDPAHFSFETTDDLLPVEGLESHPRAFEAVRFGTQANKSGFNLFVTGPTGARMRDAVKTALSKDAGKKPAPSDWVYVNNFKSPDRPTALELPACRAPKFQEAMRKLIDDLKAALPAVFQSEEYQTRRGAIDESFQKKQGEAFSLLRDKATEKQVVLLRTPMGFALAPARNGQVVPPNEFSSWPESQRREIQAIIETLEKELERIIRQVPQWEKQRRDEIRQLNRDTAKYAVDQLIDEAQLSFKDLARVTQHIETVRTDLIDNVTMFMTRVEDGEADATHLQSGDPFDRYEVNVLITQDPERPGAPIVEELHPTFGNLVGRIEYMSIRGALVTNFRLIKGGALHRANGGYLLLDARSVLNEPFAWSALKRLLLRGEIAIEDIGRMTGLASTISLEPDPVPLRVKVILFGERFIYFLLAALDPELKDHFKVLADFDNELPRTPETEGIMARLLATLARQESLLPFDRAAVGRLLEYAARMSDHAGKLSLAVEQLREVMIEADIEGRTADRPVISRAEIEQAIAARRRRASRLMERMHDAIVENIALIDTEGQHIGQINGLSVVDLGGLSFGCPTRITCQVHPGSGKVVDIEREAELGGSIHTKGVLILSGFIAGRYALDTPMSLFASLVFEQSYGNVEGDSASSAELYALLSALAETPLRQDLAVTGSVNQHGAIQAIGGVNEKIEGFFDVCLRRGLSGGQGVLIPRANVQHLMLRSDVVDACAAGRFAIYPIATVDEGIALMTGITAGVRREDNTYPAETLNFRVERRLRAFAEVQRSFGGERPGNAPTRST